MHIKCVITASAQPGRVATLTLKHSWSKEKPLPGSEVAGWASPCNLHPEFLVQRTLQYDLGAHNFVAAAEAILGPDLANLHKAPFKPPADTPPALRRAPVDADARGKGVGEALNVFAIAEAQRQGALTVDLTSRPSREAANRLYQRLGFNARETNVYRYQISNDE